MDGALTAPSELATRALERATTDPAAADLARLALADAEAAGDIASKVTALRALGMAAMEAGDLREAIDRCRSAIAVAESAGLDVLAAEARMSLAPSLALMGEGRAALAECEQAARSLSGVRKARAGAYTAVLLYYQGRFDDALARFATAIPGLHRGGDRLAEAKARHNRGVLCYVAGDLARAKSDAEAAAQLFRQLGVERQLVGALHNLGMVEAGLGDLPAALARFGEADEVATRIGEVDPRSLTDRCAALLPARLGEEAKAAAGAAVDALTRTENEVYLAEALLAHAEACLLTLDPATAAKSASAAHGLLVRQGRRRAAALAGASAIRARWLAGERSPDLVAASRHAAAALEREGLVDAAIDLHVVRAELAMERRQPAAARRSLARALRLPRPKSTAGRIRRWHADALAALLAGDPVRAHAALRAGQRVLERHRATLGATELRARAAGHSQELASLGLQLATSGGNAARAFEWAECWHAASLLLPPVRATGDRATARDLAELRRLTVQVETALPDDDNASMTKMRRRQSALEAAINRRARSARGAGDAVRQASMRSVAAATGESVLLELFTEGDDLWAVVVGGGHSAALTKLGIADAVRREIESVRFALRRLAAGGRSAASIEAALASFEASGCVLDQIVLGPVRARLADRPVVIVPTGAAHALPWAALPSLRGRPTTVAPSATAWLRATSSPSGATNQPALVAGPRLPAAMDEIDRLRRSYPGATALVGSDATASAVLAALDGAALAHVAAHGTFRADNPLFSALEMADGPLTVHDLERLRRPPATLVLPSCDTGLSSIHPGDELIGLVASLLALGTRTIIASLLPVPDDTTLDVMVAFHRRLTTGDSPASALAHAQSVVFADGDPRTIAAAASLVCFGAG